MTMTDGEDRTQQSHEDSSSAPSAQLVLTAQRTVILAWALDGLNCDEPR